MLKVLFVSGYKNHEIGVFKNNGPEAGYIKKAIEKKLLQLLDEGLEWVVISGQLGVELWAGETVIGLKEEYPELQLAVLTPFLDQESGWNESNQEYYHSVISCADFVESISKQPYTDPSQFRNRNRVILHKCDGLLLVYDEENEGSPKFLLKEALAYKERHAFEVMQIDFYELQSMIEEEAFEHNNGQ